MKIDPSVICTASAICCFLSIILNLVHEIVQNFSIWCAFTCLMRQNTFLDSIQKSKSALNEAEIGPFFQRCNGSFLKYMTFFLSG